jgi:hypothetical protein
MCISFTPKSFVIHLKLLKLQFDKLTQMAEPKSLTSRKNNQKINTTIMKKNVLAGLICMAVGFSASAQSSINSGQIWAKKA